MRSTAALLRPSSAVTNVPPPEQEPYIPGWSSETESGHARTCMLSPPPEEAKDVTLDGRWRRRAGGHRGGV